MTGFLHEAFGIVCGQNPAHTWSPGGDLLPCCQRCLGLYAGAALAALLHWTFKPRLTGRFLEIHGLFLLVMVPFGFHWLPQDAPLRGTTGVLFGFGLVTFLLLAPDARRSPPSPATSHAGWAYAAGMVLTLLLIPALAQWGGRPAAAALVTLSLAGVLVLAALAAANLALGLAGVAHLARRCAWRVRP